MYTLTIHTEFSSAHILHGHTGNCKRMHGHNWKVEVEVSGNKLDNIGMVIDFKDMKKSTNEIAKRLDHQYLNELEPFKTKNPTAENISEYFFVELSKIFNNNNTKIKSVKLWETDRAAVTYSE
ncbi:MAG: 6-carboxytetrahydropterin synthase QueD [Gammaproteobacteria bacterium]|nr:6-carboxytetrahydropterin synthase QueD [Gammaproteobacteria bacterium]